MARHRLPNSRLSAYRERSFCKIFSTRTNDRLRLWRFTRPSSVLHTLLEVSLCCCFNFWEFIPPGFIACATLKHHSLSFISLPICILFLKVKFVQTVFQECGMIGESFLPNLFVSLLTSHSCDVVALNVEGSSAGC